MRKQEELTNPNSCMSKAKEDELTFVLLGRDEDAPKVIIYWCLKRIARGKNKPEDSQITEAIECALNMVKDRINNKM